MEMGRLYSHFLNNMEIDNQKSAYERYLTERLDSGESKNIAIETTADLIRERVAVAGKCLLLDIGCFSGAMLNRIRAELTPEAQALTTFVGADIDAEILEIGRKKYQGLDLREVDLTGPIEQLGNYDIVILANIIHETFPAGQQLEATDTEAIVKQILDKVSEILSKGGKLVILDGLKPKSEEKLLVVNFANLHSMSRFMEFSQEYKAFPVQVETYGEVVVTRVKDLAAFLTKARYLHEAYWAIETTQNYQYFSEEQFRDTLQKCGFAIDRLEPQKFAGEFLSNIIESIFPSIEYPAKNVLIVARKVN